MSGQDRTPRETQDLAFDAGRQKASAGRWLEASVEFGRALQADPGSVRARLGRALARQRLGDHREALEDLEVLLDHAPRFPQALYAQAWSHQSIGNMDLALQCLEAALGQKPDFVDALYLRGVLRHSLERPGAQEDFDRVLEIQPSYREAALARGKLHVAAERWSEAETDFDQALRHTDSTWTLHRAEALHWRGVVRSEQGRPLEAVADLDEALSLRPGDAALLTRRALAHQRAGNLEAATADFREAHAQLRSRSAPSKERQRI